MNARARREEMMHLCNVVNDERIKLAQTVAELHKVTNLLINEAERLYPEAINESPEGAGATSVRAAVLGASSPAPHKRACGLCGEPGHRRTTCPKAHEVQADKKAKATAKEKPAKAKRTLSPERRQQLVETLKKARAARKGKK